MKKNWLWGTISLLATSLFLIGSTAAPSEVEALIHVFEDMNVTPEKVVIHHGSKLAAPIEKQNAEQLAINICDSLDIPNPKLYANRHGSKWSSSAKREEQSELEFHLFILEEEGKWVRPYISLQSQGEMKTTAAIRSMRQEVESALRKAGIEPSIHLSMQGRGAISKLKTDKVVEQMLSQLDAVEIEAMRTEETTSISAYSPFFQEELLTDGRRMNVQAAARIDPNHQRMVYTIGTPIITIEY
ncbi:YwmB family TATA-box binding protein [Mechercharimyces sp. CAU 1602]|uniref:YwmB family TATA-box binding protein n=1 Tax=Mechercharimyces sp. CAU 1602 TaxID=2973933 RepID=UPI002161164F|nr:YwmB family TATA-box binding protein [Mechercharimyces sp. CAU 1602]MCS1352265.1 YwmB family TATA-box binding protein [Mechercharimyces sp. CAU 1602]